MQDHWYTMTPIIWMKYINMDATTLTFISLYLLSAIISIIVGFAEQGTKFINIYYLTGTFLPFFNMFFALIVLGEFIFDPKLLDRDNK